MTDTVDEFHPDLRLVARVLPRNAVMSATVPVLQRITGLAGIRTPAGVEVHDLGDGVRVRLHRPPSPSPSGHAMLWIHGGGYVIGSAAQDDKLCREFARRLGITVAAVDSRRSTPIRSPCRTVTARWSGLHGSPRCRRTG